MAVILEHHWPFYSKKAGPKYVGYSTCERGSNILSGLAVLFGFVPDCMYNFSYFNNKKKKGQE